MSLSTEERLDALERGLIETNKQIGSLVGSVQSVLARIDAVGLAAGIEANREAIGRNTRHLVNIEQRMEGIEISQQRIIDLLTSRN
ncbi:MAG: hypothetical protein ACRC8Y_16145 [Chroococcales cyanobacterium]|jgi:hypothetical protein